MARGVDYPFYLAVCLGAWSKPSPVSDHVLFFPRCPRLKLWHTAMHRPTFLCFITSKGCASPHSSQNTAPVKAVTESNCSAHLGIEQSTGSISKSDVIQGGIIQHSQSHLWSVICTIFVPTVTHGSFYYGLLHFWYFILPSPFEHITTN